ncbi:MAG: ArsR/SmtB family transcription factor [Pseudonocardia sp.]
MPDDASAVLDRSFRALSHPVRRAIVDRLARGPASVAEATRGARASKPAITKHLRVLEDAGIVQRDVRGRTHVLTLRPQRLATTAQWIDAHRTLWERKLDVVAEYLEEHP